MLRPYSGRFLKEDGQIFNYHLSRARCVIENTFRIMAARFRIFRRRIIAHAEKVMKITKAACALHNYLKIYDFMQYCPPGYDDHEDPLENFIPGDWQSEMGQTTALRTISHVRSNYSSHSAAGVGDKMKEYFISPGEIEWQYRHVRS